MKKILSLVLAFVFIISFSSCKTVDKMQNINKPHFTAKVIEKYDNSCLVEVTSNEDSYPTTGEKVVVSTNIDDCPQYEVGDLIKIVYNGEIAESYPLQIHHVYSVSIVDGDGNVID